MSASHFAGDRRHRRVDPEHARLVVATAAATTPALPRSADDHRLAGE